MKITKIAAIITLLTAIALSALAGGTPTGKEEFERGKALFKRGSSTDAYMAFNNAVYYDPGNAELSYQIGKFVLENYSSSLEVQGTVITTFFNPTVKLDQSYGDKCANLVYEHTLKQHQAGVFAHLETKGQPNPISLNLLHTALGYASDRQSLAARMEKDLRKYVERSAYDERLVRVLVNALADKGFLSNRDRAISLANHFLAAGNDEFRPINERIYLNKLAWQFGSPEIRDGLWTKYRDLAKSEKDEGKAKAYRDLAESFVDVETFGKAFPDYSKMVINVTIKNSSKTSPYHFPDVEPNHKSDWIHVDLPGDGNYSFRWNADGDDENLQLEYENHDGSIVRVHCKNFDSKKFYQKVRLVATEKKLINIWVYIERQK